MGWRKGPEAPSRGIAEAPGTAAAIAAIAAQPAVEAVPQQTQQLQQGAPVVRATLTPRSCWAAALVEARAAGYRVGLASGDRLAVTPTPPADLAEALDRHRARIVAFLGHEAVAFAAKVAAPSWRPLGGGWWEDPATGHLRCCEPGPGDRGRQSLDPPPRDRRG